jgi:hypothetical protein
MSHTHLLSRACVLKFNIPDDKPMKRWSDSMVHSTNETSLLTCKLQVDWSVCRFRKLSEEDQIKLLRMLDKNPLYE